VIAAANLRDVEIFVMPKITAERCAAIMAIFNA
jgi:hypothetical protein